MTTDSDNIHAAPAPINGPVVAQFFGIFNGVSKEHYARIVATAPFQDCNLLILAFIHTVTTDGVNIAAFLNDRDDPMYRATFGDLDIDRVKLVVSTARAKNSAIKILLSLGWGTHNDAGLAAQTPGPFADSVRALLQYANLDGVDIDYESTSIKAPQMLALAQALRLALNKVTPKRQMVMTITPAQEDGLDKSTLQAFDYVMPQTYDHGGNGTTAKWYKEQLGSFARIVYGLNSEGYIGQSDDPVKFANLAKQNHAAGIFAWRLDNDSVDRQTTYPTFATGIKMWSLMHSANVGATG